MRCKELLVTPIVLGIAGLSWMGYDAYRVQQEHEKFFAVPNSKDPEALIDFMRKLNAEAYSGVFQESWHYQRAYASMRTASKRLRELVPANEPLPQFAALCGLSYRIAETTHKGKRLSDAAALQITDDLEAYLLRNDAIPSGDDDRMLLRTTVTLALAVMEHQASKDSMRSFAKRMEAALTTCNDVEFRDDISEQLRQFSDRANLLGQPFRLEGQTLSGESFNTDTLRGKVVLIEFWATTCGPCVSELPVLQSIYDANKDNFEIVGVSNDRSRRKLERFLETRKTPWPQLWIDKQVGNREYCASTGINQLPSSILLDQDATVVALNVRPGSTRHSLQDWIARLINER